MRRKLFSLLSLDSFVIAMIVTLIIFPIINGASTMSNVLLCDISTDLRDYNLD